MSRQSQEAVREARPGLPRRAFWLGQSSVCCLVELGRADENDDYIVFRWEW